MPNTSSQWMCARKEPKKRSRALGTGSPLRPPLPLTQEGAKEEELAQQPHRCTQQYAPKPKPKRTNRKMVEDLKRKLLIVLTVLLLLSSAQAGSTDRLSGHQCTDFQTANFLRGSKLKVQFLLFTHSSPSCGELILADDGIKNCSFNSSLETKIIIHGFRALGTKPSWIEGLVHAILHSSQVNVIAVDWIYGSTAAYPSAVENVTLLALSISQLISKLLAMGVSGTSIHIIGVSLGAHVAGLVGHFHGGQLGRITGLDPAGPKYTRASPEERLDPGDALFVEAIHTDADNFGIRIPVGHIDYFVNGGRDQPGCPRFISAGYKYLICDHMRAVHLYVSALKHSCLMVAFPCASHQDFLNGRCLDCVDPFLYSCPRIGLQEQAGVNMRKLPKEVKVYLMTSPSAPFCAGPHHACPGTSPFPAKQTSPTSCPLLVPSTAFGACRHTQNQKGALKILLCSPHRLYFHHKTG